MYILYIHLFLFGKTRRTSLSPDRYEFALWMIHVIRDRICDGALVFFSWKKVFEKSELHFTDLHAITHTHTQKHVGIHTAVILRMSSAARTLMSEKCSCRRRPHENFIPSYRKSAVWTLKIVKDQSELVLPVASSYAQFSVHLARDAVSFAFLFFSAPFLCRQLKWLVVA